MQKANLLLVFFLSAGISLFSQNEPTSAPLNPDFINFMVKLKNGKAPFPGADAYSTGAIPPPGLVSFDNYQKINQLKSTTFAPVYDLRTMGLLTPVRGQTNNGCWAFATMASVESQWLVLGLNSWDLSENNLKYCHGFVDSRSYYGNHNMSTAYFARRAGPLLEADDPNTGGSPGPRICPTGKIPAAYITEARYLPNDMNAVKQAILDHGAIFTMMYINQTLYYNATNFTYYCGDSAAINHAVDLVGWDDTKVTAGGTGAWICRNSYGLGWGEAGYFYVSYNDRYILDYPAYWPAHIENVPVTQVYGYDDLGHVNSFGYGTNVCYMLVKYNASAKQLLSKVGTYAVAAGTKIDIDIFNTFDPVSLKLSDSLFHQANLPCTLPGYYTFDLTTPLPVEPGNDFYVRVRYETPAYKWPAPAECYENLYAEPVIESNVAWMSGDGKSGSWFLIGNTTADYKWDPCVKVYAEPVQQTLTWTGNTSGDWNDASNWSPSLVPDGSKDVLIPAVASQPVVNQAMATPAACKNLAIDPGSSVTVNAGKALTVYGTLANHAGNTGLIIQSGASLITKGAVNGTATVKSDITGSKWHFISSPLSDATAGIFTGKYLQKHTEPTNFYTDITSVAEVLIPVKGYALWGDNSGFTAQYAGMLNTGNQSVGLTRTASGLNSGWNLVGNPYPSSIDWDGSGWAKSNLNNAIYIENNGQFATYVSGAGTNGGTRFIAPGQGFFVNVAGIGPGSLAMNNFVRRHNATTFFKNAIVSDSLVRIEVSGNGYADEAVVRFMPDVTTEFDGEYDALKLFGYIDESAQIYTLGSVPLSINSLPHGTYDVQLGIHAKKNGTYTLAATHTGDLADITLEDIKTGISTKLTVSSYSFAFDTLENEQRFILHFNTLSPVKIDETATSLAGVYSYNQEVYINLKEQVTGDILIYNISGQQVAARYSARGMNSIRLPGAGIFIVKVISPGSTMVKKVWVY